MVTSRHIATVKPGANVPEFHLGGIAEQLGKAEESGPWSAAAVMSEGDWMRADRGTRRTLIMLDQLPSLSRRCGTPNGRAGDLALIFESIECNLFSRCQ